MAAETILFNLLIESSPYEPRRNDIQRDVSNIAATGQMLSAQHYKLQMQVVYLTTAVNETLRQEVMHLDTTLEVLKTTSTPVFLQALAAEELMNRTIVEFQAAQEEIAVLVEFYIPNITESLSAINSSHIIGTEALQSLTSQLSLLSIQANHISDLVFELQYIINASVITVDDIAALNDDIFAVTVSLQHNVTYIQHNVYLLVQQVRHISLEIMQINTRISELSRDVPQVPSLDELSELQENLSNTQGNITQIANQLKLKPADLYYLQDILSASRRKVDAMSQILSDLNMRTTAAERYAQQASDRTMSTLKRVQQKLTEAEGVLLNLQNYSDNTFAVAQRANEALITVTEIIVDARVAVETATAIRQNVSVVSDIVEDAVHHTISAENITQAADRVSPHTAVFVHHNNIMHDCKINSVKNALFSYVE